ncbi:MAG: dipeptidase [Phycisphaerae bacterium]|jgi:acetylornithine deacetylase/succinyl-diaminopimelate desuccinylase-like protein
MLDPAISKYLLARRDEHLAALCELLAIPSIANVSDNSCDQAAAWLANYLGKLGADVKVMPTAGQPNVLADFRAGSDRPTLLIYGHYDVQPADPLELWHSPPFTPQVRNGFLYARGASDDKGQLFAHIMAVEAFLRTGQPLPINVKFFLEGEEEIGSPNLESFIVQHAAELSADAAVISDSEFFAEGVPSITYSLRGLAYVEITLRGPNLDLHSGTHGGAVTNPVNALARMIAAMHDDRGRVTIPGFYDDVLDLGPSERQAWAHLPFDEAAYSASLGVDALGGGESDFPVLERRWSRPTLDCNGIVAGYVGKGAKTIIPAQASAKVSMRLVPRQDPEKIIEAVRRFVAGQTPPGLRADVVQHSSSRPVMLHQDSAAMTAARDALASAFGAPTVMIRNGASVPVTEMFQRILGLEAVLMGLGLPEDGLHGPNERFKLDHLWRGSLASAAFIRDLAPGRK